MENLTLSNIWSWIEKNRFTVIAPVIGVIIWITAVGCTPVTESPFNPGTEVTASELEIEYSVWLKENEAMVLQFEAAGKDLEQQAENQAKILEFITTLASGNVADWSGFATLALSSGIIGLFGDNLRKNIVITNLKSSSTTTS